MSDLLSGIPDDPNGLRVIPLEGTVVVRKKSLATVTATRAYLAGTVRTDRGPMDYEVGDWLLSSDLEPDRVWPVTDEYLRSHYERAHE